MLANAAFYFVIGLGLASVTTSRAYTIGILIAWRTIVSHIITAIGALGAFRELVPDIGFVRLAPDAVAQYVNDGAERHPRLRSPPRSPCPLLWLVVCDRRRRVANRDPRRLTSARGPAEVEHDRRPREPAAARPEQERDDVRDLARLEQPLHRLPLEDHVLEHALLRQPVGARLIRGLRLDERRAHVTGQTAAAVMPTSAPSSASVRTSPSTPCFAAT